jgi:putative proteasome-type protease
MTYCLGMKINEGLVVLADGRITAGTQVTVARKVVLLGEGRNRIFFMSSGLRSVRDKVLAYWKREMNDSGALPYDTVLDALNAYCRILRRVAEEDRPFLEESHLPFNLHAIIGGQLEEDKEPQLFMVYPEGNWVAVDERTPYFTIGATPYGKPIVDRALTPETPLTMALKIAYLSFDSTRVSASDVGYPLDILCMSKDRTWRQAQFEADDMVEQRQWWNSNIKALVASMPEGGWMEPLLPTPRPAAGNGPGLTLVSEQP